SRGCCAARRRWRARARSPRRAPARARPRGGGAPPPRVAAPRRRAGRRAPPARRCGSACRGTDWPLPGAPGAEESRRRLQRGDQALERRELAHQLLLAPAEAVLEPVDRVLELVHAPVERGDAAREGPVAAAHEPVERARERGGDAVGGAVAREQLAHGVGIAVERLVELRAIERELAVAVEGDADRAERGEAVAREGARALEHALQGTLDTAQREVAGERARLLVGADGALLQRELAHRVP